MGDILRNFDIGFRYSLMQMSPISVRTSLSSSVIILPGGFLEPIIRSDIIVAMPIGRIISTLLPFPVATSMHTVATMSFGWPNRARCLSIGSR